MRRRLLFALIGILCLSFAKLSGQNANIKGRVIENISNEAIPFATVIIEGTTQGAVTDIDGYFTIQSVVPGTYNVSVSFIGFKKQVIYEYEATTANPKFLEFRLEEDLENLEAVEITASQFNKTDESPVSMQTINQTEIQRNPGGNRDISRVIQSLPGVATTTSFRNDIIIRGGAPNENRFFLDGVEVPNINHFATQGSSGGPVGMLNVDLIREVDLFTGAFPTNRYNALSSVMEIKQIDGNSEKVSGRATLGSSDLAVSLNGPATKNSTYIVSVRRSYLQFLFSALKLPFLPTYTDYQFKYKWQLNNKNQINVIGLGAFDDFVLNKSVNEGETDPEVLERNNFILNNIPVTEQWNYTLGATYKHFKDHSYQLLVVSRNHLNNTATKYYQNDESSENNLLLRYTSEEIENKVRLENHWQKNNWKMSYGLNYEYANYLNATFNKIPVGDTVQIIDFNSSLNLNKFGAFIQASRSFFSNRLTVSLGLRTDFNDYNNEMMNAAEQMSPRVSASYQLTEKLSISANTGIYYQLPPYTALGYRDQNGSLLNADNGLDYIRAEHFVAGFQLYPSQYTKISIEGFLKKYSQYPFLLRDSISLANLGADFGVIGNEPAVSISKGRSYGLEFLVQQKLQKGFYGILAYTFVISEFQDKKGNFIPSSWDFGNVISLTGGKKFKKNWELGMRWRFTGPAPFTPYNVSTSAIIEVWDVTGTGVLDYNQLNAQRSGASQQLDVRIDKKYYFKNKGLNLYLDIQNIYGYQTQTAPSLNMLSDASGTAIPDPNNPGSYQPYFIENTSGTVLPTLGVIFEF
ncbi:MAG: TonB-dependent receptor [Vicingaceae bacterium]